MTFEQSTHTREIWEILTKNRLIQKCAAKVGLPEATFYGKFRKLLDPKDEKYYNFVPLTWNDILYIEAYFLPEALKNITMAYNPTADDSEAMMLAQQVRKDMKHRRGFMAYLAKKTGKAQPTVYNHLVKTAGLATPTNHASGFTLEQMKIIKKHQEDYMNMYPEEIATFEQFPSGLAKLSQSANNTPEQNKAIEIINKINSIKNRSKRARVRVELGKGMGIAVSTFNNKIHQTRGGKGYGNIPAFDSVQLEEISTLLDELIAPKINFKPSKEQLEKVTKNMQEWSDKKKQEITDDQDNTKPVEEVFDLKFNYDTQGVPSLKRPFSWSTVFSIIGVTVTLVLLWVITILAYESYIRNLFF